jgi:hypothetical protein
MRLKFLHLFIRYYNSTHIFPHAKSSVAICDIYYYLIFSFLLFNTLFVIVQVTVFSSVNKECFSWCLTFFIVQKQNIKKPYHQDKAFEFKGRLYGAY